MEKYFLDIWTKPQGYSLWIEKNTELGLKNKIVGI